MSAGRPKADLGLGPTSEEPVCESGRTLKFLVQGSVAFAAKRRAREGMSVSLSASPSRRQKERYADTIFARLWDRCPQGHARGLRFDLSGREEAGLPVQAEVAHYKEFATHQKALSALQHWLSAQKVTHVAMESTGVYRKPVWYRCGAVTASRPSLRSSDRFAGMRWRAIASCCWRIRFR